MTAREGEREEMLVVVLLYNPLGYMSFCLQSPSVSDVITLTVKNKYPVVPLNTCIHIVSI